MAYVQGRAVSFRWGRSRFFLEFGWLLRILRAASGHLVNKHASLCCLRILNTQLPSCQQQFAASAQSRQICHFLFIQHIKLPSHYNITCTIPNPPPKLKHAACHIVFSVSLQNYSKRKTIVSFPFYIRPPFEFGKSDLDVPLEIRIKG